MDKESVRSLVEQRLAETTQLRKCQHNSAEFKRWRRNIENMLRAVYGENSNHYRSFQDIYFRPSFVPSTYQQDQESYMRGLDSAEPFLQALLIEIDNFGIVSEQIDLAPGTSPPTDARLALEIKDRELRDRCSDLLAALDKYDRAVREACVILEHRIRTMTGADSSVLGVNLMSQAFRRDSGAVILADDSAEQEGAHQLYRGIVGFLKNPTSHRLITSYSKNRALEVIGFVDFLLDILQEARPRNESTGDETGESTSAQ